MSWLDTLSPGDPVRICTASTTRVDHAIVTTITATEMRCGRQRFARDGRGIESTAWLEPWRPLRPIGRPRKNNGATP